MSVAKVRDLKVTLKSLKVHNDMSEETLCFSATIYIDGKKAGYVRNDGRGGSHFFDFIDREVGKEFTDWANAQDLEYSFEKDGQIIDALIDEMETEKEQKRWCKKAVVFRVEGDEEGIFCRVGLKSKRTITRDILDQVIESLSKKHNIIEVLNEKFLPKAK